mmetsp:Transcript_63699/g.138598  ORF Transcript_63699/g.138598 Transcript_63699/m.138598 type:complete len:215 (+) Transcript_63699:106-750(+)|eukprot:CAMPEP_0206585754 /NCGR_PEP_ID=MMETSP0325_2-20121206/36608_1 /ASSEMBLY_ACC=CAM_ASM_000347 /TAXON_ID=2866 /ORGANISM="Crypthecodinium cohnii, Strain Seligo" /LENGTH=214 /DNA_ID=CAMNT_0054093367 /DNA_START=44 /DNA_END=688 /DNA_ORIENTATION=+
MVQACGWRGFALCVSMWSLWSWAANAQVKIPIVKWGQKSDRLFLTIPLKDVQDPMVKFSDGLVEFSASSHGDQYEVKLPLLRHIASQNSSYVIHAWNVQLEMPKKRKEPCWKRLLKGKTSHSWLKRDHDKWYTKDCQAAKEKWRVTYFTRKMQGKSPNAGPSGRYDDVDSSDSGSVAKQNIEEEKQQAQTRWENTRAQFVAKAIPRTANRKKKN